MPPIIAIPLRRPLAAGAGILAIMAIAAALWLTIVGLGFWL